MREIIADTNLIAFCGLYCGGCQRYLAEKCPGCSENERATWCGVRACCMEDGRAGCADCIEFPEAKECGKFSNCIARAFGFIFRSDRAACVRLIREKGRDAFAREMAARGTRTIRP
ncbi:MAG: hypothetical protein A2176_14385 [Spirochaetes bacterium RBG_13_51_14]|nr:MAG: hypothetical protein A2176_14385 [Spirochaetes bacterium RBG_13_51_14]